MADISSPRRILLPVLLAVMSVTLLLLLAPSPSFAPRGIVLPAQVIRPPTQPDKIALFTVPPGQYQTLGIVRVEQYYSRTSSEEKGQIVLLAKQLAAQVGANGLLVVALFPTPLTAEAEGEVVYNLRAIAIHLPERPFDYDKGQEL